MANVRAFLLVSFLVTTASAASADPAFIHLRSLHESVRAAVATGAERSPLFRQLVDRLNTSDLVVHLVSDQLPHGLAGRLAFVTSAGGYRYVRITISQALLGCELVAIVGHELRHAVEIADEPSIVDARSMAAFYASVSGRHHWDEHEMFDTAAAVAAGDRVRREILTTSLDGHSR